MAWPQVSDPQPGDVCTSWQHCGIDAGGGQMIHCSSTYNNVVQAGMQAGMIDPSAALVGRRFHQPATTPEAFGPGGRFV